MTHSSLAHPGASIITLHGHTPQIHDSAFIAPGCRIIGNVTIGPDVSIWYNTVIRADMSRIVIGARSNIQDGSVVHCDGPMPGAPDGYPTIIGEDVLIGHKAVVHGCTIEDRGFIGMSSTVMNGAKIESEGMLAAGAMLTPGKILATRQLWSGVPARYVRELTDEAVAEMFLGVGFYVENGRAHKKALGGEG